MEVKFEIRIHADSQNWSLRIDGHDWVFGLSTAQLHQAVSDHVTATMDCLVAEALS